MKSGTMLNLSEYAADSARAIASLSTDLATARIKATLASRTARTAPASQRFGLSAITLKCAVEIV